MELLDITDVEEIKPIRNNERKIVVSIWCLTYNHADYIRDALEGFLSQKTDYTYEIIILDDASTDGTADIIRMYTKKYPEKFHVFLNKSNIYRHPMRIEIWNSLKRKFLTGKYVAFCEGDDYWTDLYKLQKQVSYMENHPDCVLTLHDADKIDYTARTQTRMIDIDEDCDISAEELILQKRGIWPTASMVIRKEYVVLEGFFSECGVGDWPLQLHALTKGKVHYLGSCMSLYRFLHEGSWSAEIKGFNENLVVHAAKMVTFLQQYDKYTHGQYYNIIRERRQRFYANIIKLYGKDSRFYDICESIDKKYEYKYHVFIKQLCKLNKYFFEEGYIEEHLECYIRERKNLVIMGTGHYSNKISDVFNKRNIDIDGYVVSNNQKSIKNFREKSVWKLMDIPFDKRTLGVVVAIDPEHWNTISISLEENQIMDYFCPLLAEDL